MKKILIIAAVIFAVFFVVSMILARVVYPGNVAETGANADDGELKTRVFNADLSAIFETVKQIIPSLSTYGSNWKLADAQMQDDSATVNAEVPVVVFTDDLKVFLKSEGGKTSVDVYSKSRVGRSDFGENRRHVLKILNALDEKFAASR